MKRLCCYSLSLPPEGRPDLLTQLVTSVDSLRAHNDSVEIVLFAYGQIPPELTLSLQAYGVQIWPVETYAERVGALCPRGGWALTAYPLLHKFLNFAEIRALEPDQVLLLDCDTYFMGDVGRLFDGYAEADVVAREEVGSRRSHYGYDPTMVDEDRLSELGEAAGIQPAPPFNLGAVLLNNGVWRKIAPLAPLHASYAWRFMLWMAANPDPATQQYGEGMGIDALRAHLDFVSPADRQFALPYPSGNRWILDEATLWMTLGHLPATTYADFSREDVIQNGEFDAQEGPPTWVVCHYFSNNLDRIAEWVRQHDHRPANEAVPA